MPIKTARIRFYDLGRYVAIYTVLTRSSYPSKVTQESAMPVIHSAYSFLNTDSAPMSR